MAMLLECSGCTRHVRAEDGRCPFCGRPSTTAAPSRMLGLVLPLTLMAAACTSEAPAPKPEAGKQAGVEPAPAEPKPTAPEPVAPEPVAPVQPSEPADGGVAADPVAPSDDRVMATKYGGPPVMHDPVPVPVDVIEPDTTKPDEVRPAKKYGAPPRPAPKYGGPPKPGSAGPSLR